MIFHDLPTVDRRTFGCASSKRVLILERHGHEGERLTADEMAEAIGCRADNVRSYVSNKASLTRYRGGVEWMTFRGVTFRRIGYELRDRQPKSETARGTWRKATAADAALNIPQPTLHHQNDLGPARSRFSHADTLPINACVTGRAAVITHAESPTPEAIDNAGAIDRELRRGWPYKRGESRRQEEYAA